MRATRRLGGGQITSNSNVLRRKLRSDPAGPDDPAVSPAKAARVSLARAADTAFNLAVRVTSIRQNRLDLSEVVDKIDDDWALFPLVHDDGSVGVMCLEPACVVAFVERQTLGRVNDAGQPSRALTRTDKALAIPFLEVFLRQFDEALEGAPTAYWTQGYHAEDAVATRHLMVLQLDANEFRAFDMQCSLTETGQLMQAQLFLPIKEKTVKKARKSIANKGLKDNGSGLGTQRMRDAALPAHVEMDAVMCKVLLPLSDLKSLRPGELLKLPQDAARQAHLVDKIGRTSQSVHLGQLHGMRAVRLAHSSAPQSPVIASQLTPDKKETPKPKAELNAPKQLGKENPEPTPQNEVQEGGLDELDALIEASKGN